LGRLDECTCVALKCDGDVPRALKRERKVEE
jgi:hypothetical protein